VDRTSVEMFVDDGRYVHTRQVFPYPLDTRLALFTIAAARCSATR
jgi:levanbiose-producing levanase